MNKRFLSFIPSSLILAVALLVAALALGQSHSLRQIVIVVFIPAMYLMDNSPLHQFASHPVAPWIYGSIIILYLWAFVFLISKMLAFVKARLTKHPD
jgi:hypothetical protein